MSIAPDCGIGIRIFDEGIIEGNRTIIFEANDFTEQAAPILGLESG
jgi:hypothetical protein